MKKLTKKEKSEINKKRYAEMKGKIENEQREIDKQKMEKFTPEVQKILSELNKKTHYNEKLGNIVLEMLKSGLSLNKICKIKGMPVPHVIYSWIQENEDFRNKYAHAREIQADIDFDKIQIIADKKPREIYDKQGNKIYDKSELLWRQQRIASRQWRLAKIAPKKYGEKLLQEHTGKDGKDLDFTKLKIINANGEVNLS